jgi:hypothetical protein
MTLQLLHSEFPFIYEESFILFFISVPSPSAFSYLPFFTLCPLPSALYPLPCTICPIPSALCPVPSSLYPLLFTQRFLPPELVVLVDFKAIYPGVPPGIFSSFPGVAHFLTFEQICQYPRVSRKSTGYPGVLYPGVDPGEIQIPWGKFITSH